jgi:hypothetical protein
LPQKLFVLFILTFLSDSLFTIEITADTSGKGKIDRWLNVEIDKDWKKLDINKNDKPDESCFYIDGTKVYFIRLEKLDSTGSGKPNIQITNKPEGNHYTTETEADSNIDGKIDLILQEKDGILIFKKSSFKYDEIFDVEEYYENGKKIKECIDTNRDGKMDDFYYYSQDLLLKEEIDSTYTGKPDMWIDFEYKTDGTLKQCVIKRSSKHDSVIDEWHYTDEKRRVIKIVKDPNRDGKLQITDLLQQTKDAVPPGF